MTEVNLVILVGLVLIVVSTCVAWINREIGTFAFIFLMGASTIGAIFVISAIKGAQ